MPLTGKIPLVSNLNDKEEDKILSMKSHWLFTIMSRERMGGKKLACNAGIQLVCFEFYKHELLKTVRT